MHPLTGEFVSNIGIKKMFSESLIQNSKEKMIVISPGVMYAPQWCGHGSLFIYDYYSQIWKEIDLI